MKTVEGGDWKSYKLSNSFIIFSLNLPAWVDFDSSEMIPINLL